MISKHLEGDLEGTMQPSRYIVKVIKGTFTKCGIDVLRCITVVCSLCFAKVHSMVYNVIMTVIRRKVEETCSKK